MKIIQVNYESFTKGTRPYPGDVKRQIDVRWVGWFDNNPSHVMLK